MTTKSDDLNFVELNIMHSQEVLCETYPQTCDKLDVSRSKIARTKKKPAYRDLVIAALEEQGATAVTYAKNLIKLMSAKKTIRVKGGGGIEAEDNIVQFNATSEFGDILGVKAPKEFDLKHSMAAMSDSELGDAINDSVEELNGNVQHSITGTPNAAAIVTNTIISQEPAVVERSGEQAVSPADS